MKLIEGFSGFGDNILQLPVVAELCKTDKEVYLMTPIPELYANIPYLKFVKPNIPWRTQNTHLANVPDSIWSTVPSQFFEQVYVPQPFAHRPRSYPGNSIHRVIRPETTAKFNYGPQDLSRGNILSTFERQAKVKIQGMINFPMPRTRSAPIKNNKGKKIAIIRPPTDRAEWYTPSRQCDPFYTNYAATELRKRGYYVISIADIDSDKEWIVGDLPDADLYLHHRELTFMQTLSLLEHASVLVGGIGWVVPAGIAYKTKSLYIFGGRGGFDCPENITDPRMDLSNVTWAMPDSFCRCTDSTHACDKRISNFNHIFERWIDDDSLQKAS